MEGSNAIEGIFTTEQRIKEIVENKYDVTEEEFVARLIVSQLNELSRINPFLAAMMRALELRFLSVEKNSFCFVTPKNIDSDEIKILLEKLLEKEAVKDIQKYKLFSIKSAILKDRENNIILNIPIKA